MDKNLNYVRYFYDIDGGTCDWLRCQLLVVVMTEVVTVGARALSLVDIAAMRPRTGRIAALSSGSITRAI